MNERKLRAPSRRLENSPTRPLRKAQERADGRYRKRLDDREYFAGCGDLSAFCSCASEIFLATKIFPTAKSQNLIQPGRRRNSDLPTHPPRHSYRRHPAQRSRRWNSYRPDLQACRNSSGPAHARRTLAGDPGQPSREKTWRVGFGHRKRWRGYQAFASRALAYSRTLTQTRARSAPNARL